MSESGGSTRAPARVLVMVEQPLIVEVIKLTLNHGAYVTREAKDVSEATAALGEWHPHLGIIDMDIGGDVPLRQMALSGVSSAYRPPILALTRRSDLGFERDRPDRGDGLHPGVLG